MTKSEASPTADAIAARIKAAGARALAEARARGEPQTLPKEQGGPRGLEPTRYGDWERKGVAVDF